MHVEKIINDYIVLLSLLLFDDVSLIPTISNYCMIEALDIMNCRPMKHLKGEKDFFFQNTRKDLAMALNCDPILI